MTSNVIFENEFCRVCIDSMTGGGTLTLEVLERYEQDLNMIAVDANSKFAKAVIGIVMDRHRVEPKP